jgi:hypothetical protein
MQAAEKLKNGRSVTQWSCHTGTGSSRCDGSHIEKEINVTFLKNIVKEITKFEKSVNRIIDRRIQDSSDILYLNQIISFLLCMKNKRIV